MSLESDVAEVLRADPVGRINFKIVNIAVNNKQMELVAKAIERGDVGVEIGATGSLLGAAYSSFVSRRDEPGVKKLIGMITLGSEKVPKTPLGKATIFHESVHALMDIAKLTAPSMQDDEVVAYIADACYLRANRTSITGGELEMTIYKAAFAIVDSHRLLKKHSVVLKWADCDTLRSAIKAHPAYR
jgi:hypothetical protein